MLFMITMTHEPASEDKIMKRLSERRGAQTPEGIKVVGGWVHAGGHKNFMVCEASDATSLVGMCRPWSDLAQFEILPVIKAEEAMKLLMSNSPK